jgi:hypothetical protein
MQSDTKICGQCGVPKPRGDFHKRVASKDGLSACCKRCQKIYDAQRARDPERAEHRARMRPKYADKRTEYNRRWRKKNPEAYKAHTIVNNAIRDGKIAKAPCTVCGTTENIEAHHDDHSKPFEITWLCPEHHGDTRHAAYFPELTIFPR